MRRAASRQNVVKDYGRNDFEVISEWDHGVVPESCDAKGGRARTAPDELILKLGVPEEIADKGGGRFSVTLALAEFCSCSTAEQVVGTIMGYPYISLRGSSIVR